jgi:hypothetical protein
MWYLDSQELLWLEEKSQWTIMTNETHKDSKGHGQGTQVIDRKVQHLVAKGAWKDLQDDTRGVQRDFEDIPISKGPT